MTAGGIGTGLLVFCQGLENRPKEWIAKLHGSHLLAGVATQTAGFLSHSENRNRVVVCMMALSATLVTGESR